jgi:glycosyltransferase involved in cell wall biosynthesis
MRLLHIVSSLDPRFGGTTEAVSGMLLYGPDGYENEVVSLDDPASPFLRETGFTVHALGPTAGYCYTPRLIPWLKANRDRFDGVVLHGMWQYCGYAVRRTMRGQVPYMIFPHGMLDPYFKRAFPAKHLKKWVYWLAVEYWVLRDARRVLFTCAAEAELAKQSFALHRWSQSVASIGAVPPSGDLPAQRESFFNLCPQIRGKRFLLFLGRIDPKKGCDLLIDAFAKIAQRDPELELVMAGPDPQNWRAELQKKAEAAGVAARVHWPGMLRGDPKWGAFHASEAFVLPSHQENFGIAAVEALACAKPVLLSDKVNIAADIAREGAAIVEPDTVTGTGRLLERWIELQPAKRERMALQALECFRTRYDMRENAKMIAKLFDKDETAA